MSKIKNGGLDQYGAETFEQQQFGTAGVEGVNNTTADGHSGSASDSARNKRPPTCVLNDITSP